MELTPLRYFIEIARAGHMTRAAERVGVTQPALSATVKKLETEVGTELLHRTGRGVELTEAGFVFLEHAEGAVRRAESGVEAVRELVGLERGSIRIGGGATATTYLLPRAISRLRQMYDGLRFYVREAGSNTIVEALQSGELDLGIVTLPLKPASPELLVMPLVQDELRLILPDEHPLAGARSFSWTDLIGEPVVGFEADSAVRELVDQAASHAGVALEYVMELRSIESIQQMVSAGIGVGFVSRFGLPDGAGLACADARLGRDLALVRRNDRMPSPAVAEFEALLRSSW